MFTTTRINPGLRRAAAAVIGLVLVLTVVATTVLPSLVRAAPLPIAVELLTSRAQFTDRVDVQIRNRLDGGATDVLNMRDASRTLVARFTVQPGAQFPWHTHPGPVIVNIVQGDLTYVLATDCIDRRYPTGTSFVDPGGASVHTAYNPSTSIETIFVATFLDFPAEGPLSIPAMAPGDCDVQVGAHGGH